MSGPRQRERRRGKSDLVDAELYARRLVAGDRLARPRAGGARERLRCCCSSGVAPDAPDGGSEPAARGGGDRTRRAARAATQRQRRPTRRRLAAPARSRLPQLDAGCVRVLRRLLRNRDCSTANSPKSSASSTSLSMSHRRWLRECGVGPPLRHNSSSPPATHPPCAQKPRSPPSQAPAPSRPPAASTNATDSTGRRRPSTSTGHCTS